MALRCNLLRDVGGEAGVGSDFEKCTERNYITPEPIGFDAEAANDDGEGYSCDRESEDAGCTDRGEKAAVTNEGA